jgi:hypothetical protein
MRFFFEHTGNENDPRFTSTSSFSVRQDSITKPLRGYMREEGYSRGMAEGPKISGETAAAALREANNGLGAKLMQYTVDEKRPGGEDWGGV